MTAVRLARGATGRPKILKFAGCYHGHLDALLVAGGQRRRHPRAPGLRRASPRAPSPTRSSCPTTTSGALDEAFDRYGARAGRGDRGAGRRQHGPGPARADGFLAGAAATAAPTPARCSSATRSSPASALGPAGAQGRYGITPDLSMFGKVVGGGLPLAAVGGRADVMDQLAPLGPVYQAGTLSGNPLATAAGLAVLGELDDDAYAVLEARADPLRRRPAPRRSPTRRSPQVGDAHRALLLRRPGHQLRRRRSRPTTRRTRGSSTPCSTPASSSRRAATRPSSSHSPTPTTDHRPTTRRRAARAPLDRSCYGVSLVLRAGGCGGRGP